MNNIRKWILARRDAVLFAATSAMVSAAHAGLPSVKKPTGASDGEDFFGIVKGYIVDAGGVVVLAVGLSAFVWAAWAAIAKFNEARNGKAEWSEVGLLAMVAAGILIFDSYLLTSADKMFTKTTTA
jgi:integrating conjugative element membrane protein (TIGR03745 family)